MTAVGIDVGKSSLDDAIHRTAAVTRFANTAPGIRKLPQHLNGVTDARIVVEATGATKRH